MPGLRLHPLAVHALCGAGVVGLLLCLPAYRTALRSRI